MPYCSHCGSIAGETDRFCAKCGAPQPVSAPGTWQSVEAFENLTPRTASILCYIPIVGWIFAVTLLASRKFRTDHIIRFNAFQGLYLFAVWLFIHWAVSPILKDMDNPGYRIDQLLEAAMLVLWVFMMVKTSNGERYVLPLIGELAQRSATEQ